MVFQFQGLADAPPDRVDKMFREMAADHGLSITGSGSTVRFITGSLFRYMNFEPFQFVDGGTMECMPIDTDRTKVAYRVRALRAWYTLPVWLMAGVCLQAWVALAGMFLTLALVYIQQRGVFRELLRRCRSGE